MFKKALISIILQSSGILLLLCKIIFIHKVLSLIELLKHLLKEQLVTQSKLANHKS